MQRNLHIWIASALIVIGAGIFSVVIIHAFFYAPDTAIPIASSTPTAGITTTVASSSYPARLIIPALNINANVQYVGINTIGNMMAPNNFTDVSWYRYGTVPGQVGSAVMAGHVDNGLGLPGVFKHLDILKVGDSVLIQTKGGNTLHFIVSDVQDYPYTAVPIDTLFNVHDQARLNLITCTGTWVPGGKTYDHRIVIYTVLQK